MARNDIKSGWMSPADGWVLMLTLQGTGLVIFELARQVPLYQIDIQIVPRIAAGAIFLLTGFFFGAALPLPGEPPGFLGPLALRALRAFPPLRPGARAATFGACLLPIVLSPAAIDTLACRIALGLGAALMLGVVVRTPDTRAAVSWWDLVSPYLVSGLVAVYGLASFAIAPADPALGGAGLALTWLAQRRLRLAYGLSGAALELGWADVKDPFGEAGGWSVRRERGWVLATRPRPGEVASRVRLYHLGALVEEFEQPLGSGEQLDAALAHDGLRLSVSQSSVVRDEVFRSGLALLERRR